MHMIARVVMAGVAKRFVHLVYLNRKDLAISENLTKKIADFW